MRKRWQKKGWKENKGNKNALKPKPVMCSKKQRETSEGEQWGADFPMKQTQLPQAKNMIVEINNSVDRCNTWLDNIGKEEELISSELCKNKLYQKSIQKDQEMETKKERSMREQWDHFTFISSTLQKEMETDQWKRWYFKDNGWQFFKIKSN